MPSLAWEIVQGNKRAEAAAAAEGVAVSPGKGYINLKGFFVGNAWTDPATDNEGESVLSTQLLNSRADQHPTQLSTVVLPPGLFFVGSAWMRLAVSSRTQYGALASRAFCEQYMDRSSNSRWRDLVLSTQLLDSGLTFCTQFNTALSSPLNLQ